MQRDHDNPAAGSKLTRRDFARGVALAATAASLPQKVSAGARAAPARADQQAEQLSPEAEAQVKMILSKYGNRFSDEQKAEIKRLVAQAQKTSQVIREFPLDNSDEPAMTFHIYRKDRG